MGTSIHTVGERTEMFNDVDLLLTLKMMVHMYGDRVDSAGTWRESFEHAVETHGPGVVDLDLEGLRSNPVICEVAVRDLEDLQVSLRAGPLEIPVQDLISVYRIKGVRFLAPYRTKAIIETTQKLLNLLKGY